jgi:hypothetical protein
LEIPLCIEVETWPSGVGLPSSPLLVMKLLPARLILRSGPELPCAFGTAKTAKASAAIATKIPVFMMFSLLQMERGPNGPSGNMTVSPSY